MSNKQYSDEDILNMLQRCVKKHGKVTTRTFDADDKFCNSQTVKNRFGSWQAAKKEAGVKENWYSGEEILNQLRTCHERYGKVTVDLFNEDDDFCSGYTIRQHFDSFTSAKAKANIGEEPDECPVCGFKTTDMGHHWSGSECHPTLPDYYHDLITGLLLGDGSVIQEDNRHAVFKVGMSNKVFLDWLDDELGVFSSNVGKMASREDRARRHRESGWHPDADPSTYREMYMLTSPASTVFIPFREWYDDGEKAFPSDLDLNPMKAKMWYVSDGGLKWDSSGGEAAISSENGRQRKLMESYFEEVDFSPSYKSGKLYFYEETEEFLDWLGEPVPGFEYKWEHEDRERYNRLYEEAYE